jgi:hypothetical protein
MSKKKTAYRKKVKGVRYIASTLSTYFKKQYPNYKVALPKARELFDSYKKSKTKVGTKAIFESIRKKRKGKEVNPEIHPALLIPINYYDLVNYPTWIALSNKEVYFVSDLWAKHLPAIKGGTFPEYHEYFADIVNFLNDLAVVTEKRRSEEQDEWYVVATVPEFNKSKKRWESKIVTVDNNQNRTDVGFDPKEPKNKASQQQLPEQPKEVPSKREKAPETKEKAPETTTGKSEKQLELELKIAQEETKKEKASAVKELFKALNSGLITKAEFKEMYNDLK